MNLKELNETTHTIVKFSDLQTFDVWTARFWHGLSDSIEEYKKDGKDKTVAKIVKAVKKMGEKNYEALRREMAKDFNAPEFETASDASKLKNKKYGRAGKYVILLDIINTKAPERKAKLKKDLEALQKEIDKLG